MISSIIYLAISTLIATTTNAITIPSYPASVPAVTTPGTGSSWTGTTIHPNGNTAKCLDVRGNILADGTPVQIYDCNGTAAQKWVIRKYSTKVQLFGTNYCLDAGSAPASGVGMKIWTCYDGLPAQSWYFTYDNRLVLDGRGQCLDLPNGDLRNANQVQTWQCTDQNPNQFWTV